jgi:hypothetical protein
MRGAYLPALLLSGALPLAAMAADPEPPADSAGAVLREYCAACHDGPMPRAGVRVLDRAGLLKRGVVVRGKPDSSELLQLVESGSMPPGVRAKPTPEQINTLRDWIKSGAQEPDPVLLAIAADLNNLVPDQRRLARYVSFHHLKEAISFETCRDALTRGLNLLSREERPVRPEGVDRGLRLFRIDLSQLGWDDKQTYLAADKDNPAGTDAINLYDLLLLEYPAPVLPDLRTGPLKVLDEYLNPSDPKARQARPLLPVVYVRGDWFLEVALNSPLYDDLLRLPRSLGVLEHDLDVDVDPRQAIRAGRVKSDTARGVRIIVRRPTRYGPTRQGFIWQTQDPLTKDPDDLLKYASDGIEGEDSQVIFSLRNGLPGFFTSNGKDGVRREPLIGLGGIKLVNGGGCIRCHLQGRDEFKEARGPLPFTDEVIDLVDKSNRPNITKMRIHSRFTGQRTLNKHIEEDRQKVKDALEGIHDHHVPDADPIEAVLKDLPKEGVSRPVDGGLIPLDGLTLPDWPPAAGPLRLSFTAHDARTDENTPIFHPGDNVILRLSNGSEQPVFFELVYVGGDGSAGVREPPRRLEPAATYEYPRDRSRDKKPALTMNSTLGTELYILYASFEPFVGGTLLRNVSECGTDRVVHRWYDGPPRPGPVANPNRIVKKTLRLQVVEKINR